MKLILSVIGTAITIIVLFDFCILSYFYNHPELLKEPLRMNVPAICTMSGLSALFVIVQSLRSLK